MFIPINLIGPRQEWQDLTGDRANARESVTAASC